MNRNSEVRGETTHSSLYLVNQLFLLEPFLPNWNLSTKRLKCDHWKTRAEKSVGLIPIFRTKITWPHDCEDHPSLIPTIGQIATELHRDYLLRAGVRESSYTIISIHFLKSKSPNQCKMVAKSSSKYRGQTESGCSSFSLMKDPVVWFGKVLSHLHQECGSWVQNDIHIKHHLQSPFQNGHYR